MARMSRRELLSGLLIGPATLLAVPAFAQPAPSRQTFAWRDVNVRADAFPGFLVSDPHRREFGPLTFMGGLELRGDVPEFGGFRARSSIRMAPVSSRSPTTPIGSRAGS